MMYRVKSKRELEESGYKEVGNSISNFESKNSSHYGSFPKIHCGKIYKFLKKDSYRTYPIILRTGITDNDIYPFSEFQVIKLDSKLAEILYE
jgi:hypothetical protein